MVLIQEGGITYNRMFFNPQRPMLTLSTPQVGRVAGLPAARPVDQPGEKGFESDEQLLCEFP